MHRVSLIVSTLGERPDELRTLLLSLEPQARFIAEVIVVDQNDDPERLVGLLDSFRDTLPLRHTRSNRGLSKARNHGLAFVTGDLVAFPDDDCVYPDGLLEWVLNWFITHFEYDILAVGAKDAEGVISGNRWPQDSCEIKPWNAFRTTFSPSLFICADLAQASRFDTSLGVGSGTPYGSGEETDYVLRLLRLRARGRFDRERFIIHPRRDMLSGHANPARAFAYGVGMGHVLRINAQRALCASFIAYNLSRAVVSLFRRNIEGVSLCLAQTNGISQGFRAPVKDDKRRNRDRSFVEMAIAASHSHQLLQFPLNVREAAPTKGAPTESFEMAADSLAIPHAGGTVR